LSEICFLYSRGIKKTKVLILQGFSGPDIFINRNIQKSIVGGILFIQKWSIFVKKRMLA